MSKFYKVTGWILASILLLFVVAVLFIRFDRLVDRLIYGNTNNYDKLTSVFKYEEQYITVGEQLKLHAALFKPVSGKIVGTIFHFPGQGMHLMGAQKEYGALLNNGFQVFSYERRGFGHSEGKSLSTPVTRDDALLVFDQLLKRDDVKHTKIIIWGQSIGGPLAITTAAARNSSIVGLVVEGTFGSFPELGQVFASVLKLEKAKWLVPVLMNNDFPAKVEIEKVTVPTVIIHSTEDEVIPFALGKEIFTAADKNHTAFWIIRGMHIKGMMTNEVEYVGTFKNLLKN